jgi:hypothetical protein
MRIVMLERLMPPLRSVARIGSVVVPALPDANGVTRLTLRMSFQTRSAIGKEFKSKLGLPS